MESLLSCSRSTPTVIPACTGDCSISSFVFGGGRGAAAVEICDHHGTPLKEEPDGVRHLQGHLAGSASRQDTAGDHRSPPERVLRVRGGPAGGTECFTIEPFYHRYHDSSATTAVGAEQTNSIVCVLY